VATSEGFLLFQSVCWRGTDLFAMLIAHEDLEELENKTLGEEGRKNRPLQAIETVVLKKRPHNFQLQLFRELSRSPTSGK